MRIGKAAVVLFVLAVGVLLNFAVPPFQNPDEPLHLAMILRFARGEAQAVADEAEIVRLLERFNWWRFTGMRRPEKTPERLEEIPFLIQNYAVDNYGALLNNVVAYHYAMAKVVRLFGGGSGPDGRGGGVLLAYYLIRLTSLLFFGAALLVACLTFRRFSGYLAHGFLFVLFLPQLAVNSIGVNPDAAILLLGSVFFWAAFALIGAEVRGRAVFPYFAALCLAPVMAVLLDKSAFLLLPLGALAFVFVMTRRNYQDVVVWMLLLAIVFILSVYFLSLAFPLKMETAVLFLKGKFDRAKGSIGSIFAFDAVNGKFISLFVDSFFLRFGWKAFGAGRAVDWIWRILVFGSGVGVGLWWARLLWRKFVDRVKRINAEMAPEKSGDSPRTDAAGTDGAKTPAEPFDPKAAPPDVLKSRSQENRPDRLWRIVLFSLIAVAAQSLAVRLAAAPDVMYAQGRYLFPFIIPAALLFVLGIRSLFDLFAHRGLLVLRLVLVLMFVLFNIVLWGLMIPVFHLTLKSPFPGI
ncbi:MAG: DUF2142 domain-containing protein [Candidatus Aminicenantes bacterium]|nr:DUF2142 domain-containing protein [Candidatus Aminicenantes bacterium]